MLITLKNFILDLLFPYSCIVCGKQGNYICEDCLNMIEVLEYQFCPICAKRVIDGKTCANCKTKTKLNGAFSAVSYDSPVIKKMIKQFKYTPFIKDISLIFSYLIIKHFLILSNVNALKQGILIPVPLHRKKLKNRGYNQSQEIAKHLSRFLNIPLYQNVLIKTKNTHQQVGLLSEQRQKNIKGAFACQNIEQIKNKKIFLIDDVFTTGATTSECSKILKQSGANEVWAVTVARE
ncbi:MAG: ComF family protein [Patescibacteria group bacterium]|nr:ComF family protein [Patescibacteria group bacterium]